jgi:hypothetical protein
MIVDLPGTDDEIVWNEAVATSRAGIHGGVGHRKTNDFGPRYTLPRWRRS